MSHFGSIPFHRSRTGAVRAVPVLVPEEGVSDEPSLVLFRFIEAAQALCGLCLCLCRRRALSDEPSLVLFRLIETAQALCGLCLCRRWSLAWPRLARPSPNPLPQEKGSSETPLSAYGANCARQNLSCLLPGYTPIRVLRLMLRTHLLSTAASTCASMQTAAAS